MIESEAVLKIQKASRAFPFALRSPEAILRSLSDPNGSLPIIEVYLGHKRGDSKFSPNMLSPIGGKMYLGESISQAAYRRVMQETALSCSPLVENEESKMMIKGSFKFNIKRSVDPNREVYFSLVPVISPHIVTGIFPIQDDSKVDRLIGMSVHEFIQSINLGYYDGPNGKFELQGHITKLEAANDIDIDSDNIAQRNFMLDSIVGKLESQEIKAKAKLYRKLKYFAEATGKAKGIFPELETKTEENSMIIESNNLKKIMVDLQSRLGVLFIPIFKQAYSTVVGEFYMDYFRKKEKKIDHREIFSSDNVERLKATGEIIKRRFLDGNFGVDLLHFLPLFINQEGAIKGKTTRLITEVSRFIRDIFRMSIDSLSTFYERGVDESRVDFENRRLIGLKDYFLNDSFLLENKRSRFEQIDNNLIRILSEVFGFSEEHVKRSWATALPYIPDITNEAKLAAPEWRTFYQVNQRRNEITNASLGQALLLSLGIDIKWHHPKEMSLIKFEALLQLIIFLKELFISPTYDEIVKSKPHPVDLAISEYFGTVQQESIMKLGTEENERVMKVTYRKAHKSRMVIVDEKPFKSKWSVIRKSFEERVEDIVDIFSCSIILPDDAYRNYNFSKRTHMINQQADGFISFLEENYPNWKVIKLEDKDTFVNYYDAMDGTDFSSNGKRTGSKGDLLIRRKVKIQMIDPDGKNYFYEMVFYPYASFTSEDQEKERSLGLMAWKEKIEDDPDYSLKRILFPLRGALGLHSLYELFNPPSIYPDLIERVRSKSVRVFTSS